MPVNQDNTYDFPVALTVQDLEDILNISHNTAYELVRSGKLRSIKIGRLYRVPRDALLDYLDTAS